jgi:hypothetical protein
MKSLFIKIMTTQEKQKTLNNQLIENSKSAIFAALEIHNKPLFFYRYEVCTILVINAWELLLKAYISKKMPHVNLFLKDKTTKPFKECLACVASSSGKEFQIIKESLELLYNYRNNIAHFYLEHIDVIIFSLLKSNVIFFVDFLRKNFKVDLSEENCLVLLPIGFKKPYSPIDFLSNKSAISNASSEVKDFIESIIDSCKSLKALEIEDSILVDYTINLVNEKRIKNSDLIAAISRDLVTENKIEINNLIITNKISNNPNAKEIRIKEQSVYDDIYTENYKTVTKKSRELFSDFVQNQKFHQLMKIIKENPNLHRVRYLDPLNPKSSKQSRYSQAIYEELAKHFTLRSNDTQ